MKKLLLSIIFIILQQSCVTFADPPVYMKSLEDAIALSQDSEKDILVIFTADWCPSCDSLKEFLDKNESLIENYIVCYVDHDLNRDLVKEYSVKRIPDSRILRRLKEIKRLIGFSRNQYQEWIKK